MEPSSPHWGVYLPTLDSYRQGTPPVVEAARRAEALGVGVGGENPDEYEAAGRGTSAGGGRTRR